MDKINQLYLLLNRLVEIFFSISVSKISFYEKQYLYNDTVPIFDNYKLGSDIRFHKLYCDVCTYIPKEIQILKFGDHHILYPIIELEGLRFTLLSFNNLLYNIKINRFHYNDHILHEYKDNVDFVYWVNNILYSDKRLLRRKYITKIELVKYDFYEFSKDYYNFLSYFDNVNTDKLFNKFKSCIIKSTLGITNGFNI